MLLKSTLIYIWHYLDITDSFYVWGREACSHAESIYPSLFNFLLWISANTEDPKQVCACALLPGLSLTLLLLPYPPGFTENFTTVVIFSQILILNSKCPYVIYSDACRVLQTPKTTSSRKNTGLHTQYSRVSDDFYFVKKNYDFLDPFLMLTLLVMT